MSDNTQTKLCSLIDKIILRSADTMSLADEIKKIEEKNAKELIGNELNTLLILNQDNRYFTTIP